MNMRPIGGGKYRLDFILCGVRFSKTFPDRASAHNFTMSLSKNHVLEMRKIGECVNQYLESVTIHKAKKARSSDKHALGHMLEFFGDKYVSEIKLIDVESYRASIGGVKNTTINRRFNTIKHFFNCCEKWGYVIKSPCLYLRKLPKEDNPRLAWSGEEIKIIQEIMRPQICDFVVFEFLRLTGARLSSAAQLKVQDIDIKEKSLKLVSKKGHGCLKYYQIPFCDELVKIIYPLVVGKRLSDFVFLDQKGNPLNPANFAKRFSRLLQKHNLGGNSKSLHSLRHSFARQLNEKGVPINHIKKLLGHSNIRVTEGYLHSDLEDLRKAIK